MRKWLVLSIGLLIAWGLAGQAMAGMISISGNRLQYDVIIRDADRVCTGSQRDCVGITG